MQLNKMLHDRLCVQIVKKASKRLKHIIELIDKEAKPYEYENNELRVEIEKIRYMIDNLKLDLDTCVKKSKTYIVNKILSLKEIETEKFDKIRENRNFIESVYAESNTFDDVISDEYYDLFPGYF